MLNKPLKTETSVTSDFRVTVDLCITYVGCVRLGVHPCVYMRAISDMEHLSQWLPPCVLDRAHTELGSTDELGHTAKGPPGSVSDSLLR